jgi:hypothetical protein
MRYSPRPLLAALALAAALIPAAARASDVEAAVTDCVASGSVLAAGTATVVAPIAACALKPVAKYWADGQPEPRRTEALQAVDAIWAGAAVNNVVVLIAHGAGAVAPVLGVVVAVVMWMGGEKERERAAQCAVKPAPEGCP